MCVSKGSDWPTDYNCLLFWCKPWFWGNMYCHNNMFLHSLWNVLFRRYALLCCCWTISHKLWKEGTDLFVYTCYLMLLISEIILWITWSQPKWPKCIQQAWLLGSSLTKQLAYQLFPLIEPIDHSHRFSDQVVHVQPQHLDWARNDVSRIHCACSSSTN